MPPPYTAPEEAVTRVIAFFENLSPADVATIGQFYAPQARRQDEWGRTMHHPGHRWYPYYSGTSRPWLRCIYRF